MLHKMAHLLLFSFAVYFFGMSSVRAQPQSDFKDYCQSEYFNVTCSRNDVILMEHAQYGRMRPGRCVSGSYGVVGCSIDVLNYFDRKCSGRKQCTVYIGDPSLHKLEPCSKDFTTYLEAKYTCLSVVGGSLSACQKDGYTSIWPSEDAKSGFMASASTTEHGGIGSAACPWRIQVGDGQTVRLSLLSFGGKRSTDADDTAVPSEVCYEIGEVKDGGRRTTLSMCGGSSRESVVYASTGNDVIVQLLSAEVLRGLAPFVLKYDVQGCRKLIAPPGGWVHVEGNTATVRCNGSRETMYLTCTGTKWMGQVANCTSKAVASRTEGVVGLLDNADTFPYGILIVVAIGVALGVLIGGVLLSVVAYYMRRRSSARRYVADDVIIKHAGSGPDDDDAFNESATTNRLMPSHYNMPQTGFGSGVTSSAAYLHHHHHVLQQQQQQQPSVGVQWLDVTTVTTSDDDVAGPDVGGGYTVGCHQATCRQMSAGQQDGPPPQTIVCNAAGRGGTICAGHLYESPRFQ